MRAPENHREHSSQPDHDNLTQLSFGLLKSVVGSGILSLPAAVASVGGNESRLLPIIAGLIMFLGGVNAWFFQRIGEVCEYTGASTYKQAWDLTVGREHPQSGKVIGATVVCKTLLACLAYCMILADSSRDLLVGAGILETTRNQALLMVSGSTLLPLCLLKDFTSLAPFAFVGLLGMGFTIVTMLVRWQDGSYAPGGLFGPNVASTAYVVLDEGDIVLDTSSTATMNIGYDVGSALADNTALMPMDQFDPQGLVVVACTLATAFVAHYNAPRFYNEISDKNRFAPLVQRTYLFAGMACLAVAVAGVLTFGSNSQGLILNSYSPYDPLVNLSRIAIFLAIALAFPLPFVGLRDGVLDLSGLSEKMATDGNDDRLINTVSVLLLGVVTFGASIFTDLASLLAIGGGTFSTVIASVFPTIMYQYAAKDSSFSPTNPAIVNLSVVLMVFCVMVGASGVATTLQRIFN